MKKNYNIPYAEAVAYSVPDVIAFSGEKTLDANDFTQGDAVTFGQTKND